MQIDTRHLGNASPRLGSQVLFVAGRTWTADDAVAFASFRGTLGDAIAATSSLVAAEERVADEEIEIRDADLQASAEAFRYEHDLISAGETEAWMRERGLTIDDFGRWLYQRLCSVAVETRAGFASSSSIPDDFPDLLRTHLWLSGEMETIVEQLRRRIAAGSELAARGELVSPDAAMEAFMEREALDDTSLRAWLDAVGRDASWLEEICRIDVAYERLARSIATDSARARRLDSLHRSLSTVEFDLLELDSAGAAREAFLCVHDDRLPLAEVARDAGFAVLRREVSMEELGSVAERLASVAEGSVVGPFETEGRFCLYHVLRKRSPSLSDPAVRRRIDSLILDEYFADLTARHFAPPRPAAIS